MGRPHNKLSAWRVHQNARQEARRLLAVTPDPMHLSGEWFTDEFGNPTRIVTNPVPEEAPDG